MKIIIFCFVIHVLFILALLILRILHILKCDYILIMIAFFVPIWGFTILHHKSVKDRKKNKRKHEVRYNRMKAEMNALSGELNPDMDEADIILDLEDEELVIYDNSYQKDLLTDMMFEVDSSIAIDADNVVEKVVPLEEAMALNDARTKRELIMDVLYSNPSDYIEQLTKAKKNDDTEVVHYAVTALVELQKEFDLKFQDILSKLEKNPDDEVADKEYLKLQERYISCGLLDGDGLRTQQIKYRNHLIQNIEKGNRSWSLQCKLADIDLKLKDEEKLAKDVKEMMRRWPDNEETYIYRLQLEILRKDNKAIKEIINEITSKDMYISTELRELIQFWSGKNGKRKRQAE